MVWVLALYILALLLSASAGAHAAPRQDQRGGSGVMLVLGHLSLPALLSGPALAVAATATAGLEADSKKKRWEYMLHPMAIITGSLCGAFLVSMSLFRLRWWQHTPAAHQVSSVAAMWQVHLRRGLEGGCALVWLELVLLTVCGCLLQKLSAAGMVHLTRQLVVRNRVKFLFDRGHVELPKSDGEDAQLPEVPNAWRSAGEIWRQLACKLRAKVDGEPEVGEDLASLALVPEKTGARFHLVAVLCIASLLSALAALRVDWEESHPVTALMFLVLCAFLAWGMADALVLSMCLHAIRLFSGFSELAAHDYSKGVPSDHRTFICYCLLATTAQSSEEAFRNAVDCYLMNLDPNQNVMAGVVSVTYKLSILQTEWQLLIAARKRIRRTLLHEAEFILSAAANAVGRRQRWEDPCGVGGRLAMLRQQQQRQQHFSAAAASPPARQAAISRRRRGPFDGRCL